jgi:hypothetical protein
MEVRTGVESRFERFKRENPNAITVGKYALAAGAVGISTGVAIGYFSADQSALPSLTAEDQTICAVLDKLLWGNSNSTINFLMSEISNFRNVYWGHLTTFGQMTAELTIKGAYLVKGINITN